MTLIQSYVVGIVVVLGLGLACRKVTTRHYWAALLWPVWVPVAVALAGCSALVACLLFLDALVTEPPMNGQHHRMPE